MEDRRQKHICLYCTGDKQSPGLFGRSVVMLNVLSGPPRQTEPPPCSCSNSRFSLSLPKADFPKAGEDIDKHCGGFTNTSLQAG